MRVLFMGTPAFAVPTLRAVAEVHEVVAVVTRPDKGRGRGRRTAFSPVKEWALEAGLPVDQPPTLRDAQVQAHLAGYGADVAVVAAYGLILPLEILQMPPRGCINVHASLLPRHRGAAPVAWAILSGDEKTGVTTMLMDEGLDTGPMLLRREIGLGPRDTTGDVTTRLATIGAELLVETLGGIESGTVVPEPQPLDGVTLAPSLKKADGAIDWEADAAAVDRQVRAMQPWPGSFTFRGNERLVVWEVRPLDADACVPPAAPDAASSVAPDAASSVAADAGSSVAPDAASSVTGDASLSGEPGTVLRVGDEGIRVACGRRAVDVLALQRAGGRRQTASEFLRGRPIVVGERFGRDAG